LRGAEAEDIPGLCLAVFGSVSPVLFDPDTDTDPDPESHTHSLTHIPTHAFPWACVMFCGAAGTPLPYSRFALFLIHCAQRLSAFSFSVFSFSLQRGRPTRFAHSPPHSPYAFRLSCRRPMIKGNRCRRTARGRATASPPRRRLLDHGNHRNRDRYRYRNRKNGNFEPCRITWTFWSLTPLRGAEAEDIPGLCLAVFGSVSPVLFDPDTDTDPDPDSHTHSLTHTHTHTRFPMGMRHAPSFPVPYVSPMSSQPYCKVLSRNVPFFYSTARLPSD
jgi:hypothetical protein